MLDPDAPSAAQPTTSQFGMGVITSLRLPEDPPALQPTYARSARLPPTGPAEGERDSSIHRRTSPSPRTHRSTEAHRHWDAPKLGERHGLKMGGAVFYLVRGED
ncbi:hypothetical protein FB451DRAFT_1394982 [Mycena latifolia]|nr:hypothetical protein FB451DRAFT_1394982 [Mycena latifolia]